MHSAECVSPPRVIVIARMRLSIPLFAASGAAPSKSDPAAATKFVQSGRVSEHNEWMNCSGLVRYFPIAIALSLPALFPLPPVGAQTVPPLDAVRVAGGFSAPLFVTAPPRDKILDDSLDTIEAG